MAAKDVLVQTTVQVDGKLFCSGDCPFFHKVLHAGRTGEPPGVFVKEWRYSCTLDPLAKISLSRTKRGGVRRSTECKDAEKNYDEWLHTPGSE